MNVLVCGGAGYIGAHMSKLLAATGHAVTVFDNLSSGHRSAVRWGRFVEGDLLDADSIESVIAHNKFDAVMHFCAKSLVAESMQQPNAYYINNVAGTLNLLRAMKLHDVGRIVFSSTAAVFGKPLHDTIDEAHPTFPINPYGRSKLMVEVILADAAEAYGLRSAALRYFNAAGASPEGEIGESHDPETHLVPNILRAALGVGSGLKVFGNEYPTHDGTCVRDYIHVDDLGDAHLRALAHMEVADGAHTYNLGNGRGFSVLEVIHAAREVTGMALPYQVEAPRAGDPAKLVASSEKARRVLGWNPRYTDLRQIVETAWRWHRAPCY